jgi:hypothetical protein
MLQSLISLSDDQIDAVTDAVREWCAANHCPIQSEKGRRAMIVAIDIAQLTGGTVDLFDRLCGALDETHIPHHVKSDGPSATA